jgi:DNA invertase Pin-like site-specific DNA recombinase
MFKMANLRTISRNSRYQNRARTAGPNERFVVEYEVSAIHRRKYQRLREHIEEYDVVVAHELDRLVRSFADLAEFVEDFREKTLTLIRESAIGTVGEDDWMAVMMLNMMIEFADAKRNFRLDKK